MDVYARSETHYIEKIGIEDWKQGKFPVQNKIVVSYILWLHLQGFWTVILQPNSQIFWTILHEFKLPR